MLDLKTYTRSELSEIFGTNNKQTITRKLDRYGVKYVTAGRGDKLTFEIQKIENEFKLYCILDVGFPAQTEFSILKYFVYYFFNDEQFIYYPQEKMSEILSDDVYISRQTISNWIGKLKEQNLFIRDDNNCIYYSVHNGMRREITQKEYSASWLLFYGHISEGNKCAVNKACSVTGGFPVRRRGIILDGIRSETIDTLTDLALKSIEQEGNSVKAIPSIFDI